MKHRLVSPPAIDIPKGFSSMLGRHITHLENSCLCESDSIVEVHIYNVTLCTRGVHVLRSPNLLFILKKTSHHTKLKMQSFLNVITL